MPDDRRQPMAPKDGLFVSFVTVEELFAGTYTFNLPWFQRAYAWSEDMASRLLDDICAAYLADSQRYFIGHVLLARRAGDQGHVLVDGQQRAVTMMILFALLRHRMKTPAWQTRLGRLIEDEDQSADARYRLSPQPAIESFFARYVQARDALEQSVDDFDLSEVEGNVFRNRERMAERLDAFISGGGDLDGLADFVLTRSLLVLEIIDDEVDNEAWRMLQTEENTGLPFHTSARTKVTLLDAMPPPHRDAAGEAWDRCQAMLGDPGMQQLVERIRDLAFRRRSSQPVEKDLLTQFELNRNGLGFVEKRLLPSAERMVALRDGEIGDASDRAHIARHLSQLQWAHHREWVTPALRWLEVHGDRHADTREFFALLARKIWILRIGGADNIEVTRRCIALSNQVQDGLAVAEMSELVARREVVSKARATLVSRTFYKKRTPPLILRYLSDLMGKDCGEIDGHRLTIEHVLPRHPPKESEWSKLFGNQENVRRYAHRLGNLALLSYGDNQVAGNRSFEEKRAVLAGAGYALSTDAADATGWTPEHIVARSDALARVIFAHWQIDF